MGFEAVLGFHHNIHQFVTVIRPLLDAAKVAGAALIVDDEMHHIVAQALLKQNKSTNTTFSIFKEKYLLKQS